MEKMWDKRRGMFALFVSLLLVIGLFPLSSYATEGDATEVTTTPIRDQEYYQTTFPEDTLAQNPDAATPVYTDDSTGYYEQQLAIGTVPGVADEEIVEMISPVSGKLIIITGNMDRGLYFSISIPADLSVDDAIEILQEDARVEAVERNFFWGFDETSEESAVVDDSSTSSELTDITSASVSYPYWTTNIRADRAWDIITASSSTVVAMIDSGIRASHKAFPGRIDNVHSYCSRNGQIGNVGYSAAHGTGTAACASSAFTYNGITYNGSSFAATILPIDAGNTAGTGVPVTYNILALEYIVDHPELGVDVVNMSFGGYSDPNDVLSVRVQELINELTQQGVTFVAAAGNGSRSTPHYPSDFDNVISVSAINQNDVFAYSFSNFGEGIDLAAPGVNILVPTTEDDDAYVTASGTSYSAPFVAGVAALLYEQDPSITPAEVEARLKAAAVDLGAAGRDDYYGSGKVNAFASLFPADLSVRLGGDTRYDTMRLVAQYERTSANTAIVVSGSDTSWPDALSASGLAGLYDAPILTTNPTSLSTQTRQTLVSLGVTRVLIVGGTSAVSSSVMNSINAISTVTSVTRISGDDRYATSEAVYRFAGSDGKSWVNPTGYTSPNYVTTPTWKNTGGKKMVILATGMGFADALSASALSSYGHYPVLLTNGTSLTSGTQSILSTGRFDEIVVAGGTAAVSTTVRTTAANLVDPKDMRGYGTGVNWWWSASGEDRYETSFLLSNQAKLEGISLDDTILASGVSSADATVASALKSPILLVATDNTLQARSFVYNNAQDIDTIIAVGGVGAVSDTLVEDCIVNWSRSRTGDTFSSLDGEILDIRDAALDTAA